MIPRLDELLELSLDDLERLWDEVPTEHSDAIRRRYNRALRDHGVADDAAERDLLDSYIARFRDEGLLPAGDKWLKLSPHARQAIEESDADIDEDVYDTPQPRRLRVAFLLLLIPVALLMIVSGVMGATGDAEEVASVGPTFTPSPTTTPTVMPTVTPLALVDTDDYVGEGDGRLNRDFYPVVLRVITPDGPPRVFVVQERVVETSQWPYDPNPDVAAWISGTTVNPVLGVPFSDDNARLFSSLDNGAEFVLRMNTGAELRFRFDSLRQIARDEGALFGQRQPGLALILIGETGDDGLPTQTRLAAVGRYIAAQERDLLASGLPGLAVPVGREAVVGDLRLAVDGAQGVQNRVQINLNATAENTVFLSDYTFFWEAENGLQAPLAAADLSLLNAGDSHNLILSGDAVAGVGTLRVLPPTGEPVVFAVDLAAETAALDVQIRGVYRDADGIEIAARLYNPSAAPLNVEDVWLVTGYTPDPTGPPVTPVDFVPPLVPPGAAQDVRWRYPWNGADPFAAFGIAGRRYIVTLNEESP